MPDPTGFGADDPDGGPWAIQGGNPCDFGFAFSSA